MIGGIGITAGAHRLWTHRAYKAKWPLRVILVVFYASAGMVDEFIITISCATSRKNFCLQMLPFRITFTIGCEIIGCTTDILIRTRIRTTVTEDSFSLISVGC